MLEIGFFIVISYMRRKNDPLLQTGLSQKSNRLKVDFGGHFVVKALFSVAVPLFVLCAQTIQESGADCNRCVEACDRSAERTYLTLKVLQAMLRPETLPDVIAEITDAADQGNVAAYLVLDDLEKYQSAVDGQFDPNTRIWKERPLAVFADGHGGGLVLYPSGWGFRLGSQMGNGFVTRITTESLTITHRKTKLEQLVMFEGVYLAGRVVDENGIGMKMAEIPTMDELIRGWKSKR